ncbi:MAG: ankyrin repeat domain-containing protein [Gammaproteobacteria bacterium]
MLSRLHGFLLMAAGAGALPLAVPDAAFATDASSFVAEGAAAPAAQAGGVNIREPDGSTPLQWAVYRRDAAEVQRLLKAGADASLANNYGATPMSLAAATGDAAIIGLLLKAKADPDSPNAEGQTALMAVARTGNVEAAKLLVRAGAHVNAREQWGNQTALMWAAAQRQPEMVKFLVRSRAEVDARGMVRNWARKVTSEPREKDMDWGGFTPLLYAAREGCIECAKELLAGGADINLQDPHGTTPLVLAIINSRFDMAKFLIEAGASIQIWDFVGVTPLYAAVDLNTVPRGARADVPSTDRATALDIERLLIERGANVNAQLKLPLPSRTPAAAGGRADKRLTNIGATPLLRAATGADLESMKLLIDHGALVELPLADGTTPMLAAIMPSPTRAATKDEQQALAALRLLKDAGADPKNAVTRSNSVLHLIHTLGMNEARVKGSTALQMATVQGWKDVMKQLAAWGVDLNARDADGLTALDYAMGRARVGFLQQRPDPRKDVAEALRSLGATAENPDLPPWTPQSVPHITAMIPDPDVFY